MQNTALLIAETHAANVALQGCSGLLRAKPKLRSVNLPDVRFFGDAAVTYAESPLLLSWTRGTRLWTYS